MPVIILVADGARPDTLHDAMERGRVPHLARLRAEGGMHTVTTAWPSVTGVAYAPFLTGRYPGGAGLPGLRWFDRSRRVSRLAAHARSYVGLGMRHIDRDLATDAPTLFELSGNALGALAVIERGLPMDRRLGRGVRFIARVARTHFGGNVRDWMAIDREIGDAVVHRLRRDRPDVVFAAFTGIDKASHAVGHDDPRVGEALATIDEVVAEIRHDAERAGRWDQTHLWIVSDHGHSPVHRHDDLADLFARTWRYRTLAHPWAVGWGHEVAVMVSGNAMAHLYLELERRHRPFWPALAARWRDTVDALLDRPSVDLVLLPHDEECVEVRRAGHGSAMVTRDADRYAYRPLDGDPLGIGPVAPCGAREAYEATIDSDYPDALVQVAHIGASPRAGDVMLSAARGWDFRERYEPIPHRSSHGALHRDHMLAPLLVNHQPAHPPRRTVDVMPSALAALGLAPPAGLDGESFLADASNLALSAVE